MRNILLVSEDAPWEPEELKRWRHQHDITQMEAAVALGVTLRAIENWETGTRSPAYPAAIRKLMKAVRLKRQR
jgi:DNA-binding transcriptional regulator YiaG